ncbi:MAG: hypothetical protein O6932_06650, partial [Gammaproteobacteria bacterium]|nr:hypothetical protein [Gammaproteobacteria bacterium]
IKLLNIHGNDPNGLTGYNATTTAGDHHRQQILITLSCLRFEITALVNARRLSENRGCSEGKQF